MSNTTYKTSHLLIDLPQQELIDLHRDSNEMGSYLTKFFLAALGRPVDNSIVLPPELADLYFQFANGILPVDKGPGSDDPSWLHSENCYSMFFEKDSMSGNCTNKIKQYQELKTALCGQKVKGQKGLVGKKTWAQLKKVLTALPQKYQILSPKICQKYFKSGNLEGFGKLALAGKNRPSMSAGLQLRELGLLPLDSRGIDKNKLLGILVGITGRLKSWRDRDWACKTVKEELRVTFEKGLGEVDPTAYPQFKQFADQLFKQEGYKISGRVLRAVEGKDADYQPVLSLLTQYPDLQGDFEELGRVYLAEAEYLRKKVDARVTVCDAETSPLQFPFGLTGNGYSITLTVVKGQIAATLHLPGGDITPRLRRSKYFQNPEIAPVKDGKGKVNGFQISFKRGKTPLVGIIKEPKLLKKNGNYYLSLAVGINKTEIPKEICDARAYYSSTSRTDTPPAVKAMSIDLGVTTLADYSIIDTGLPGDCGVFGGSTAAFTEHGKIGRCGSKSLRDGLYKNTEAGYFLAKYIRLSKNLRGGVGLNKLEKEKLLEHVERLGIEHCADDFARKDEIHRKFSEIKSKLEKSISEFALRDRPDKKGASWEGICAETVQVLGAVKRWQSLAKSWTYYSWTAEDYVLALTGEGRTRVSDEHVESVVKTGRRQFAPCGKAALLRLLEKGKIVEVCPGQFQLAEGVDYKRHPTEFLAAHIRHFNGLRRDLTNKLVRAIVEKAQQHRVQIVIVEDFGIPDIEGRIMDHYDNYRWNLFAPAKVIEKLEEALSEVGIAMAEVDPRHTSQLAPTGDFGFRDHENLYFWEKGLCRTDANTNASMRIAERFFTRHSVLSQLRAVKISETEFLIPVSTGKRENAFIKSQTGKLFAKLVADSNGFVMVGLTEKQHGATVTVGKKVSFYNHAGRWLGKAHHIAHRDRIKNEVNQVLTSGRGRIRNIAPELSPKT
ncbi:MAG: IS200/IS605 family accessory protein TnpB-related protein [Planctomycetota bacterium]